MQTCAAPATFIEDQDNADQSYHRHAPRARPLRHGKRLSRARGPTGREKPRSWLTAVLGTPQPATAALRTRPLRAQPEANTQRSAARSWKQDFSELRQSSARQTGTSLKTALGRGGRGPWLVARRHWILFSVGNYQWERLKPQLAAIEPRSTRTRPIFPNHSVFR